MSITTKRAIFHVIYVLSIAIAALFISKTLILLLVVIERNRSITHNWLKLRPYRVLHSFLAFERDLAVLALSFMAVGDAITTVVGSRIGKTKFLGKTIEGNIACLISCVTVGFVYNHIGLGQGVTIPINDNLTIPLFSGLVMTLIQH